MRGSDVAFYVMKTLRLKHHLLPTVRCCVSSKYGITRSLFSVLVHNRRDILPLRSADLHHEVRVLDIHRGPGQILSIISVISIISMISLISLISIISIIYKTSIISIISVIQVSLSLFNNKNHVDLSDYWKSGTWDIIEVPAYLNVNNNTGEGTRPLYSAICQYSAGASCGRCTDGLWAPAHNPPSAGAVSVFAAPSSVLQPGLHCTDQNFRQSLFTSG